MIWYTEDTDTVLERVKSDKTKGLTQRDFEVRLFEHGENKFAEKKKQSLIVHFLSQFKDFMVIVLIIAAVVSFFVSLLQGERDFADPIIILLIVFVNAVLGFVQENKAEKALEALKSMSAPTAKVIRDGVRKEVDAKEVVPGDILIIETGDRICADCRLIETVSLKVDESALTGESAAVDKDETAIVKMDAAVGDRHNMVFAGSTVSIGRGKAVVTETGMKTEMGKIAEMISTSEIKMTPLQEKLSQTGKILGMGALFICLFIFCIGVIRKIPVFEMFITSVSLAVAAIPEGLPAVVTIMLAMGIQKMAKKNAVVKRLPAVEALGGANVICSDKTGTLTQNKMKVTEIYPIKEKKNILTLCALCNNSYFNKKGIVGEATENALIQAAADIGIYKDEIDRNIQRLDEIPFDSKRKLMSSVHKTDEGYILVTKGAPDFLIKKCSYYMSNNKIIPLDSKKRREIENANSQMTSNALRVIATAFKNINCKKADKRSAESELIFVGLAGMTDPPRKEAKEAVEICRKAGIKPVMVTGDYIQTATAVAKKIGIMKDGDLALTGGELSKMDKETLSKNIYKYSVFARVSPENKLDIVNAFKETGAVVAMTGDGVNDAPALKAADIGCAMGITGTDVAKSAADIVLMDDNFATIVDSVKQGRGIYSNIKKAVHFLLSSNIGEIVSILAAVLIGFRTPLLAIHLLWVNLVTDSFPAIALGLDPVSDDIMEGMPRKENAGLFSKVMWFRILFEGMMIGMLALVAFGIGHVFFDGNDSAATGRTMAFAVLSISQLVHAFNMRSDKSIFTIDLLANKYLVGSLLAGVIMQVCVIMIEPLAKLFKVVPLNPIQWFITALLCIAPIGVVELEKFLNKE